MNVDTEGHLPSVLMQDQTKALLSSQSWFPKILQSSYWEISRHKHIMTGRYESSLKSPQQIEFSHCGCPACLPLYLNSQGLFFWSYMFMLQHLTTTVGTFLLSERKSSFVPAFRPMIHALLLSDMTVKTRHELECVRWTHKSRSCFLGCLLASLYLSQGQTDVLMPHSNFIT